MLCVTYLYKWAGEYQQICHKSTSKGNKCCLNLPGGSFSNKENPIENRTHRSRAKPGSFSAPATWWTEYAPTEGGNVSPNAQRVCNATAFLKTSGRESNPEPTTRGSIVRASKDKGAIAAHYLLSLGDALINPRVGLQTRPFEGGLWTLPSQVVQSPTGGRHPAPRGRVRAPIDKDQGRNTFSSI